MITLRDWKMGLEERKSCVNSRVGGPEILCNLPFTVKIVRVKGTAQFSLRD